MEALAFFAILAGIIFGLIIAVVWIAFPFMALKRLEAIRQEIEALRMDIRK